MNIIYALLILAASIIALITVVLWLICRSKPFKYFEDINVLERYVDEMSVTKDNYNRIGEMFMDIYRIDQDNKRTDRAWRKFHYKYNEYFASSAEYKIHQN